MAGFGVLIKFRFHYIHLSRGTGRNWSALTFRFAPLLRPPMPATAETQTLPAINFWTMGYDIHITRKENWFDEKDSNEIKLTEWTDYIKSDKEMRLDNQASATTDNGDQVTYENNGLAVWTSYSKNGLGDNYAWFDFRAGNVTVKNPDEEIKNKMIDIADRLNAKVQGDDRETYDTKVLSRDNPVKTDKRPWWKFWK